MDRLALVSFRKLDIPGLFKHFNVMTKKQKMPYDQQLARILVKPLIGSVISPNHITIFTLFMALSACVLFSRGDGVSSDWAAGIFVLARFFDHFDGELARQQGTSSRFGYYFDYVVGGISYAALFIGLGLGHMDGNLGNWAIVLGGAGALASLISLFSNLGIDMRTEGLGVVEATGYPEVAGFELEDGIYLIAPVTWFGFLTPFFLVAAFGAIIYLVWTVLVYIRLGS